MGEPLGPDLLRRFSMRRLLAFSICGLAVLSGCGREDKRETIGERRGDSVN
jgi:hypothetical protein